MDSSLVRPSASLRTDRPAATPAVSPLTDKENARLDQLMSASYPLTKPERKRLAALLAKDRAARAAIAKAEG
jgi:hypothetical protein